MADPIKEALIRELNNATPNTMDEMLAVLGRLEAKKIPVIKDGEVWKRLGKYTNVSTQDPGVIRAAILEANYGSDRMADSVGYIPTSEEQKKHDFKSKNSQEKETDEEKEGRIRSEVNKEVEQLTTKTIAELNENTEIKEIIDSNESIKEEIKKSIRGMVDAEKITVKEISLKDENGKDKKFTYQEEGEKLINKNQEWVEFGKIVAQKIEEKKKDLSDEAKKIIEEKGKKVATEFQNWEEKKIATVTEYRKYNLEDKIEGSILGLEENKNLTVQQRAEVKEYSQMMAKMYYSNTAIEMQRREVSGVSDESWNDVKNLFGAGKMSASEFRLMNQKWTRLKTKFDFNNLKQENGKIVLPWNIRGYSTSFNQVLGQIGNGEGQIKFGLLQQYVKLFQRYGVNNPSGIFKSGALMVVKGLEGQTRQMFVRETLVSVFQNLATNGVGGLGNKAMLGIFAKAGFKAIPWVGWVSAAIDVLKKIGSLLGGLFKKIGPRIGSGNNLGDMAGGAINKGINMMASMGQSTSAGSGSNPAGKTVSFLVLILVVVFAGLQMNNNLVATQVPPVISEDPGEDFGEDNSAYVEPGDMSVPKCDPNVQGREILRDIAMSIKGKVEYNRTSSWRVVGGSHPDWGKKKCGGEACGLDCAKFVSWVWLQCIGKGRGEELGSTVDLMSTVNKKTDGWEYINPKSVDELKIGDIFIRDNTCKDGDQCNHAVLYIGNGETMESARDNDNPYVDKVYKFTDDGIFLREDKNQMVDRTIYDHIIRINNVFSNDDGGGGGGGIPSNRFTVGTFNIGNLNKNSRPSASEIGEKIKAIGLDIVGMQEIDFNDATTKTRKISEVSGLNYFFHTNTPAGVSIISKASLTNTRATTLNGCGETRKLQKTTLKINGKNVSFYNAHISPNGSCTEGNKKQLEDVADIIKNDSSPWILVGDFNQGAECAYVNNLFGQYKVVHDENYGTSCTDMIIFPKNKGLRLISSKTYDTKTTLSDHNLVSATLEIE